MYKIFYGINILIFTIIFISLSLKSEDDFSLIKYGEMLYNDPRGVSCAKCHGEKGRGIKKLINFYISSGKNMTLQKIVNGVNIKRLSLKKFMTRLILNKILNKNLVDIMPNYYLTEEEIKLIYNYLNKVE